MKISLNWLKDYVDIPKDITPQKLGELLTLHTVEVDGIEEQGHHLDKVVIGEMVEIKKHPNADKLSIAQVDVGENKPRQIIFGQMAKMEVGFKTAVALAPTILPGNKEIKRTKLRGEMSEGMLCLDQELEILKEGVSIRFFDKNVKNGTPITEVLDVKDAIYDIDNKSLTHRPDLWSHYGIAREVAVFLNLKFKDQKLTLPKTGEPKVNLEVEIKNYKLCPRYMGVVVDNIKIEPSPFWLQKRLTAVGVRPINNIVDITNYIMLDVGQPLHAFDYNKLASQKNGAKIIIRTAKAGEKIVTLDNIERKLDNEMLVIADEKKPIALAGVMGGANSEIDNKTTRIVIESANFEPVNNRQTATKIGLRTEAVMRYEKSLDPNLTETALNKILGLIIEIIPQAEIISNIIDQKKFKLNQGPIILSTNYVQEKIGVKIRPKQISNTLENLGFALSQNKDTKIQDVVLKVKVPTWRATKDITIADDLVEEIARIYSFNKIMPTEPLVKMKTPEVNQERKFERQLKNIFVGLGFDEVYNYSFVGEEQVKKLGRNSEEYIKLLNSLSKDCTLLRQSLLENLVINIKNNLRYFGNFKIFELGSTFKKQAGLPTGQAGKYLIHPDKKDKLPRQEKFLAGVVVNMEGKADDIFFQTKEAVENLLSKSGISDYQIVPVEDADIKAEIIINNKKIGYVGLLDKSIQSNFDINPRAACGIFEISFDELFALPKTEIKYQALAKFPEVKMDLAVIAPKDILWHNIEEEIKKAVGSRLKKIELFDIYEGKNIGLGKKNLAMHLSFGESDRTMEMKEVEKLRDKIVSNLKNKLNIDIRS